MLNTMVNSKSSTGDKGRTVKPDQSTENATENSPIDAYYKFPASNCKQEETYSTRIAKLSEVLGNKDEVKG